MKTAEFYLKKSSGDGHVARLYYPSGRYTHKFFCVHQLSQKFGIKLKVGEKQRIRISIEKVGKPIKG